jgi:HSP20 family protein
MTTETSDIRIEKSSGQPEKSVSQHWLSPLDLMDEWLTDIGFQNLWPLSHAQSLPIPRSTFHLRGPSVDIIDRDQEIIVKAEIPGMEKKNLSITLQNRVLTLKGTAQKERKEEEKGHYFRRELQQGEWTRALLLPAEVDVKRCKAHFKNGMLEILLTKIAGTNSTLIPID